MLRYGHVDFVHGLCWQTDDYRLVGLVGSCEGGNQDTLAFTKIFFATSIHFGGGAK